MEASSSRTRSQGTTPHSNFQRSLSPSGRFCSSSISASTTSYLSNRPESFLTRPSSPTRINVCRSVSPSPTVRFSTSRSHSIASSHNRYENPATRNRQFNSGPKKTCMCSPTTHPGSFRCSLHKNNTRSRGYNSNSQTSFRSSHHLNMRRSAMTNSLVRIGTVEGDLVKRALAALIRPSSHHLRRRDDFQPRPSRLSIMSKAQD
ncbi:serine-rich protein-related [Abeliophyllum distichum]|uniref:Serine-rich protein-related n=1 Tax=Abeliophyllum distichum TaxID=126358 RepID=A0ABD1VPS8_9LAMI